jgi:hypothetical protein
MTETIAVAIEIPKPPDGWVFDGFRMVLFGEQYFNGAKWVDWVCTGASNGKYLVAVKAKQYREPVLPADWGKGCEFSSNGMIWDPGKLSGYVSFLNVKDSVPWMADNNRYYQHCRIEVSE